jgi:hypothetical protein
MENFWSAVNGFIDFIIKLTPLIGLLIAYLGLSTWRRQIKGTDRYKVASELLLEVYRVREAIKMVRSPFVEFAPAQDETASEEMNAFLGYAKTMDERWKQLTEPVVQLSLVSLKAEVHLGRDIKHEVDELMKLVRHLQIIYESYLDYKRPGSGFGPEDFTQDDRKVLWAKPSGDKFDEDVQTSVAKIEGLVRGYL